MAADGDLFDAIAKGDVATVRAVLADDPSRASARNGDGVSAILHAKYHRQETALQALLAMKPALDVFEAAALGDVERLTTLLDEDPARARAFAPDGFTALHLAVFFAQRPAAALLLDRGADPRAVARNAMKVEPLHSAVASTRCDVVALLLDRGADPDPRQQGGYTALHACVKRGDFEMVGLLLDHAADITVKTDEGQTALDLANGDRRMLFLLKGN
jgi:adenosylhomocysteine nucleosidase